jgi:AcrR family transcriptional regulator
VTKEKAHVLGLRDRKKIKLRETILQISERLFREQGYEKTTLERICDEAETSLRTLLRYFPTKEDLALGREMLLAEDAAEAFANLDPAVPVMQFWRDRVNTVRTDLDRTTLLAHVSLIDSSVALQARMLALQVRYEDLLAHAFAREAGLQPENDLHGRLLAGLLIAGNRAAMRRWAASKGKLNIRQLRNDVIDWAVANFPPRPTGVTRTGERGARTSGRASA